MSVATNEVGNADAAERHSFQKIRVSFHGWTDVTCTMWSRTLSGLAESHGQSRFVLVSSRLIRTPLLYAR